MQEKVSNSLQLPKKNIGYVIYPLGDKPLDAYSTADAASLTDWSIERPLSSTSIQRIFSTRCPVINLTVYADGLFFINAFAKKNTYLLMKDLNVPQYHPRTSKLLRRFVWT